MNTYEQFVWEDVMKVCAVFGHLAEEGHKRLAQGLPAVASEEEQTRLVKAMELLHRSIFELSTLMLDSSNQTMNRGQRPFLYLV